VIVYLRGHEGWGIGIASRTVFWAVGVVASPATRWFQAEADRARRLKVGPDLSVPGLAYVFAIGDTALAEAGNGRSVPGLPRWPSKAGTMWPVSSRPGSRGSPAGPFV
jgi:NADH dehydrogenase FAD-containing subunit